MRVAAGVGHRSPTAPRGAPGTGATGAWVMATSTGFGRERRYQRPAPASVATTTTTTTGELTPRERVEPFPEPFVHATLRRRGRAS